MNSLSPDFLALAVIQYVVFLFSTTCHEASHALAAKLGGDPTAFHSGQVSLNPLPHIRRETLGMVVVPILALITGGMLFGWASAPYDPRWQEQHPRRAAWMSLAGPAANLALVLLAAMLIHAGLFAGVFQPPLHLSRLEVVGSATAGAWEGVARFLSVLFSLNLLLGVFNLLPIPPLDGFSAVGLILPAPAAALWSRWGQSLRTYSFLVLLLGWQLFGRIYWPIFGAGLRLLYPHLSYR